MAKVTIVQHDGKIKDYFGENESIKQIVELVDTHKDGSGPNILELRSEDSEQWPDLISFSLIKEAIPEYD